MINVIDGPIPVAEKLSYVLTPASVIVLDSRSGKEIMHMKLRDSDTVHFPLGPDTLTVHLASNSFELTHEPNYVAKAAHLTKAVVKHVAGGSKYAEPELVEQRFNTCKACAFYRATTNEAGTCTHKTCGCRVNVGRKMPNKLLLMSEHCPIGKW